MIKSRVGQRSLLGMLLIIGILVFSSKITYASQWAKIYDVNGYSYAMQQTSDGGYILAGTAYSFGAGAPDSWVLKLDTNFNVQWQKTYGGTLMDETISVQQTSDGGYILAGFTESFGAGDVEAWILKLDNDGNILWQKTYGGTGYDQAFSIQQTSDGGYIVGNRTNSFGADVFGTILKLDSNGNFLWHKSYGCTNLFIERTKDGGYIVDCGKNDFMKLDSNGTVIWHKAFSYESFFGARFQQTSDGGYIVVGFIPYDVSVLKLDSNGNFLWHKIYGGTGYVDFTDGSASIQQTTDGGYILVLWTYSFGAGGGEAWILKLDNDGNILWQKTYGSASEDGVAAIQQTTDGGYILAGWTNFLDFLGDGRAWILKIDANGDIPGCPIVGTSDATASSVSTSITLTDKTVIGIDIPVSLQTSTAISADVNPTVTQICPYEDSFPDVSVFPIAYNFGSINVGSPSAAQAFTISNTGTADLHVSGIALSDSTNYSLNVNGGCGSTSPTITPSSSCTVTVTFNPLSTGQKDASLTVTSDDPDTQTLNVSLSGTGVVPDISVSPSLLTFRQVVVGSTSTPQTVTISNTGTANLVISSIGKTGTDAGMFNVATGGPNPCPNLTPTISPGGNCTVNVTFSPTSKLQKTAALSISSNDTDENPVNVSLRGTGVIVKLTRPNGGEVWKSGTTERITWQTTNPPPTTVAKHRLRYTLNGGTTWKTIVTRSGNSGWYDWKVASVLNIKKRGKVKVVLLDSLGGVIGSDVSDKVFTIHPANGGSGGCTACH